MIKVFLVEDEFAIREGIRRTVNWEKEGFVLCGEAGDGEMAYPLILKEKPEILITDIRMPFMDGLELCRLVKEALPSVRILILSGYDDFSYAQEAIRIGVEEYLLKPLSEDMLLAKLRTVAEKIREEQASERAIEQYQIEREEIRYLERQQFFRDIVDGKVTVQQSLAKGKELGVEITSAWYSVVLVQIREKEEHYAPGGRSAREEEMLAFLRELRERLPFLLLYEHTDGAGCLIVKADSEEEILARQETVIGELQAEAQNHRDVIYFIATGCPVDRLRDIRQSYREAVKMFAERYVYDESRVFRYGEKKAPAAVFGENGRSGINFRNLDAGRISQKYITNFMRGGSAAETDDFVADFFAGMGEEAVRSYLLRQYVVTSAVLCAIAFLEELGLSREEADKVIGGSEAAGSRAQTYEESKRCLKEILDKVTELRNQTAERKYNRLIHDAQAYIEKNYASGDISLQSVAASVGVSPNHFSSIFRQETGETFIDFLTHVRMEHAKELLLCTPMRTAEIGFEVGYNDPHYFSYAFRKAAGMSPREFRNAGKRDSE